MFVLGGWRNLPDLGNDINNYVNQTGVIGLNPDRTNAPFTYGTVLCFANKSVPNYSTQFAFNVSQGKPIAFRIGTGPWKFLDTPDNILLGNGVFIMCHRKSDNFPIMFKPNAWTAQQNAGEVADGVVVVEGGHVLVVAPTDEAKYWSSAIVAGGGVTTTNREAAYSDWAGRTNTESQITHAEMSGESYAPGFCHAYSRMNANGQGLTAGRWWLPSLGEMMMIYANMTKINYALSLINGATQLVEQTYWTSTEFGETGAWFLTLSYGYMRGATKSTYTYLARPVSRFIS